MLVQVIATEARQVVWPRGNRTLVTNRDELATVYVGTDDGMDPGAQDVDVIDPLGSKSYDGKAPRWAMTLAGTAVVESSPGASASTMSPAQIAAQIAAAGVPLIGAPVLQYLVQGQTVAPGAQAILQTTGGAGLAMDTGALSYDLLWQCNAGGGSTFPFLQVDLFWFNSAGIRAVGQETWVIPMAAAAGSLQIRGSGPVRGQTLQVNVTNLDTVAATITTFELFTSSRLQGVSNWQCPAPRGTQVPPGFTPWSAGAGFDATLGMLNQATLAAPSSQSYVLGMFAGRAQIRAKATGATSATSVNIVARTADDASGQNNLCVISTGQGNDETHTLLLPRAATIIDVIVGGVAGPTVNIAVTAQPVS